MLRASQQTNGRLLALGIKQFVDVRVPVTDGKHQKHGGQCVVEKKVS